MIKPYHVDYIFLFKITQLVCANAHEAVIIIQILKNDSPMNHNWEESNEKDSFYMGWADVIHRVIECYVAGKYPQHQL